MNKELNSDEKIILDIGENSHIEYNPNFLSEEESIEYLNELLSIKEC